MAFRGDINALILGALEPEPLHGYELVRRLREAGGVGKLSEGQVYPYLHKLEADGLLTASWNTETGGAPRRVYQITPSGRAELTRHQAAWRKFANGVDSLMRSQAPTTEVDHA